MKASESNIYKNFFFQQSVGTNATRQDTAINRSYVPTPDYQPKDEIGMEFATRKLQKKKKEKLRKKRKGNVQCNRQPEIENPKSPEGAGMRVKFYEILVEVFFQKARAINCADRKWLQPGMTDEIKSKNILS